MIRNWLTFAILALLIDLGGSCSPKNESPAEMLRRRQFADVEVFLSITNGSPLAEAQFTLGPAMRHQFSVVEANHVWKLALCFLHTGEEESFSYYQLLFCDDVLSKTIGRISMERETIPYRDTTATRVKPWDIEDIRYAQQVFVADAVAPEQIRAKVATAHMTMDKYKGKGNLPKFVGRLFAPRFHTLAEQGFPLNEKLRQKYDGFRLAIGMSSDEVRALFGPPLHIFTTSSGRTAHVYGVDEPYLGNAVDHFLVYPYVAVLFDSAGSVSAVFSDRFFCRDWHPNLPAWRRE